MDTQHAHLLYLYMDDFGDKYHSQEDAQYLINALKETYEIKVDFSENYYGLTLDWQYVQGYVYVSISTSVGKR